MVKASLDSRIPWIGNLEVCSRHPKTKFSAQSRFVCPRGTEDRDKGQRQEIEDEGGVKENKGEGRMKVRERGKEYLSWRTKH